MLRDYLDQFWHRVLGRPYVLHKTIDQGGGIEVVLLHGLASSGATWDQVASLLADQPYHVLSLDLLGFGESPKPDWPKYSVDDHARAVIATILRSRQQKRPVIVVGHSMGGLVAVRVARLRPDLVKHLILYQIPLYAGLPDGKKYSRRRDFYLNIYNRIIAQQDSLSSTRFRRTIMRMTGLKLSQTSSQPFIRSLRYTVVEQNTLEDMRQLNQPMDIIYGSLDLLVIKGKPADMFAQVPAPLETHKIMQLHNVSNRASKFITKCIMAAAQQ